MFYLTGGFNVRQKVKRNDGQEVYLHNLDINN